MDNGQRATDEGLRIIEHPRIVFRSGPAGRRPGLMSGPDVWEIVRAVPCDPIGDEQLAEVSELTGLTPEDAADALRYHADHPDEVDEWIRRVEAEAERAEAGWRREQERLVRFGTDGPCF